MSGDLEAAFHLYWLHAGQSMPAGIELQHRDPIRAYAYLGILVERTTGAERQRFQHRRSSIGRDLTADELRAAAALSRQLASVQWRRRDSARALGSARRFLSVDRCD
jgi:hypothetical protein